MDEKRWLVPTGTKSDGADVLASLSAINTLLTTNNAELADVNSALATNNAELADVNSALATANAELADVNSALATANTKLADVNSALATTNAELADVNSALATANAELADVNSALATTNAELADVNSALATVNASVGVGNASLAVLESTVDLVNVGVNIQELNPDDQKYKYEKLTFSATSDPQFLDVDGYGEVTIDADISGGTLGVLVSNNNVDINTAISTWHYVTGASAIATDIFLNDASLGQCHVIKFDPSTATATLYVKFKQ